ncbi:S-layer homology domain-containing protein [Paenibacillus sp. M1]|uniref:S-layer homology domain-containing protein n=1 Tax=Paenibacillus haidiansis TaxID=1574488 RepID=A0ABU7VUQ5_9BACL
MAAGVIDGRNDNTLAPQEYMSRAEVTVIIERLLQKSGLI